MTEKPKPMADEKTPAAVELIKPTKRPNAALPSNTYSERRRKRYGVKR